MVFTINPGVRDVLKFELYENMKSNAAVIFSTTYSPFYEFISLFTVDSCAYL